MPMQLQVQCAEWTGEVCCTGRRTRLALHRKQQTKPAHTWYADIFGRLPRSHGRCNRHSRQANSRCADTLTFLLRTWRSIMLMSLRPSRCNSCGNSTPARHTLGRQPTTEKDSPAVDSALQWSASRLNKSNVQPQNHTPLPLLFGHAAGLLHRMRPVVSKGLHRTKPA